MASAWGGVAQAQTTPINDTGQALCDNGHHAMATCSIATAGDASVMPRQDGRHGRDAATAAGALAKAGGGAAGFDFSCVLWNGTVVNNPACTSTLVANTTTAPSATPATDWACTKDNVTGLIWSLNTQQATWLAASTGGFSDPGHNAATRCGLASGWRLPTRRELLGIVHNGLPDNTPLTIDTAYFPGTSNWPHWSSNTYVSDPGTAWFVLFNEGSTSNNDKAVTYAVRLVRSSL